MSKSALHIYNKSDTTTTIELDKKKEITDKENKARGYAMTYKFQKILTK